MELTFANSNLSVLIFAFITGFCLYLWMNTHQSSNNRLHWLVPVFYFLHGLFVVSFAGGLQLVRYEDTQQTPKEIIVAQVNDSAIARYITRLEERNAVPAATSKPAAPRRIDSDFTRIIDSALRQFEPPQPEGSDKYLLVNTSGYERISDAFVAYLAGKLNRMNVKLIFLVSADVYSESEDFAAFSRQALALGAHVEMMKDNNELFNFSKYLSKISQGKVSDTLDLSLPCLVFSLIFLILLIVAAGSSRRARPVADKQQAT